MLYQEFNLPQHTDELQSYFISNFRAEQRENSKISGQGRKAGKKNQANQAIKIYLPREVTKIFRDKQRKSELRVLEGAFIRKKAGL